MSRISEDQIKLYGGGNYPGLEDYFNARVVRRQPFNSTNKFTLASAANVKLVDAPTHVAGGSVISKGAIASSGASNQGGIVSAALAGVVGSAANTSVADSSGNILNLLELRESVSNDDVVIVDGVTERRVYGLMQCSSTVTDSDVVGASGSENIQISFVYFDSSDALVTTQIPAGTYEFQLNTLVARRFLPVLAMEGGAIDRDVIDLKNTVKLLEGRYDVTTAFPAVDVWDLATGAGTTGVSTASGDYATLLLPSSSAEFVANPRVQVLRNGVEQRKGVEVVYNSTTGLHFVAALAIGEEVKVRVPYIY